jgi:hypothetical protein
MRLVGVSEAYSLVRKNNKTQIVKPHLGSYLSAAFCYSMVILLLGLDVPSTILLSLGLQYHSCKGSGEDT